MAIRALFPTVTIAGALLTACVGDVHYQQSIPFSCAGDGLCPPGYACVSNYCVPPGTGLPLLVDESAGPFVPQIHRDVDRDGAALCWTRAEDTNAEHGGIYAAFMGTDGSVHGRTTLYQTDTRNQDYAATCAPIPHSDGKILVAVWLQQARVGRIRLLVWTPDVPNGFTGTTRTFYEEVSPDPSALTSLAFRADVVGDEAWVPYERQPPDQMVSAFGNEAAWARFRVSTADLTSGTPRREALTPRPAVRTSDYQAVLLGATDNPSAWLASGSYPGYYAYVPADLPDAGVSFSPTNPAVDLGFGTMLATQGDDLAVLLSDPDEARVIGDYYSLVTVTRNRVRATQGPRLPFSRLETHDPGAMRVGNDLYLFGAPYGLPPRVPTVDAGAGDGEAGVAIDVVASDAIDGSAVDTVIQAGDGASSTMPALLGMYRIAWKPDNTAAFTRVRTLPRRFGDTPVSAAVAWPLPDAQDFGLGWVTVNAPDAVGHGVRYALYLQHFSFR